MLKISHIISLYHQFRHKLERFGKGGRFYWISAKLKENNLIKRKICVVGAREAVFFSLLFTDYRHNQIQFGADTQCCPSSLVGQKISLKYKLRRFGRGKN